ncbi:hypothetical protein J6590_033317 [Homalodisca vitripennis]|nr:hypothetical protein J6590_033317 [Homalodisca vitripennis]
MHINRCNTKAFRPQLESEWTRVRIYAPVTEGLLSRGRFHHLRHNTQTTVNNVSSLTALQP